VALVVVVAAGALGVLTYLVRLHAVASALVTSASEIRTKADAEREIADWRKRFGEDLRKDSDRPGMDHDYDAQVANFTLAKLHIVQPTDITVRITMRDGQLWAVAVIESTGWDPVATVWVQEWFDEKTPKRIRVVRYRRPDAAWVAFPASLPDDLRRKAFRVNIKCLVSPRISKTDEEILPGISQLESTTPN